MRLEDFNGGVSVPDNTPAWTTMLDAMQDGGDVELGIGDYRFSQTITDVNSNGAKLQLRIFGRGASEGPLTRITVANGKAGIVLHKTELNDVSIHYDGSSSDSFPEAHGIVFEGSARLEDVFVRGFPGNGIHISADHNRTPPTNANGWRITGGKALGNGGHGLFVDGGDANAGLVLHFRSVNNGQWGIFDSSFLGNTYIQCPTSSNELGAVHAESQHASCFFGCYVEGGSGGGVEIKAPSVWIGSLSAPSGTGTILDAGEMKGIWRVRNTLDANNVVRMDFGSLNVAATFFALFVRNSSKAYRLMFNRPKEGWIGLAYPSPSSDCVLAISTEYAAEGPGELWLPKGFYTGQGADFKKMTF